MVNSENSLLLKCEYFGIFRQWLCFFMVFRKFSLYFLKISNFLFLRFLWSLIQSPQTKQCYQMGGRSPLTLSACIFTVVIAYISRKVSKLNLQSISWYAFSSFEFAVFVCPTYRPLLFAACAAIKKPPFHSLDFLTTSAAFFRRFIVASRLPVRKIFRILQRLNWGCGHSARLQKFQALPPCSRFGSCSSVPIGLLHL